MISLKRKKYFKRILGIGIILTIYIFRVSTSEGFSWEDTTKPFTLIGMVFLCLFFLIYVFFCFLKKLWKKTKLGFAVFWILVLSLLFLYYLNKLNRSCVNMQSNILSTPVKYEEGNCKWTDPKICWHFAMGSVFKYVNLF